MSLLRASTRCQNSRSSVPGNGAESFCDWCLKIAWILVRSSSCESGTSQVASVTGHSCHAPRYSHTSGGVVVAGKQVGKRGVDGILAEPMGTVRIGEVAGDEQQVGLFRGDQIAHDRHVVRPDRRLPHRAGPIERQVEEPGVVAAQAERLDAADRLGLADDPLQLLHVGAVHLTGRLGGEKRPGPGRRARSTDSVRLERARRRQPLQHIDVAEHVMIEHGDVAAGHVRHHAAGCR